MSRYTKTATDKTLIYGHDHALGYFYEEWLNYGGEEEALLRESSVFLNRLSRTEFLEKLHQYRVREDHILLVAGDLPF